VKEKENVGHLNEDKNINLNINIDNIQSGNELNFLI